MASNYWLKLYHEMLDDPKVMTLRPALRWRFIETLLVAGELDKDGLLPPVDQYAWRVRDRAELVETELNELSDAGLLSREDGQWLVTKFAERQRARTSAERVRRYRERQKKQEYHGLGTDKKQARNASVTFRYTDIDKDKEVDIDEIRAPVRSFCEIASRPMPDLDPDNEASVEFWLIPGCYFLSLVGWDKDKAAELVTATVEHMDRSGLSYKNLASLVNVARTVKSQMNGHGAREAWSKVEWALDNHAGEKLRDYPDIVDALNEVGGWPTLRDGDDFTKRRIKKQFMREYNDKQ